jgi:GMP synthase (glutamine-hydrolysing)
MHTLLIVKLGSTYPWLSTRIGDFDDWIIEGLQGSTGEIIVVSPPLGQQLPASSDIAGIILTGSHAMATTREPWSENTAIWIVDALRRNKPILGICYGHQLLAHAAGGIVGYNEQGKKFGIAEVTLVQEAEEDPLFQLLPSRFPAHVCHSQVVLALPERAILLAASGHDPHLAFRIGSNAWGVQFHPEFSPAASRAYIEHHADELRSEGENPEEMLRAVRSTPEAGSILRRFRELVLGTIESPQGMAKQTCGDSCRPYWDERKCTAVL